MTPFGQNCYTKRVKDNTMNNSNELCDFLTQPQVEEQYDAEYNTWLQELSDELDRIEAEFELADDAPGMLEAYPELWARMNEVVGCDTEEDTLS